MKVIARELIWFFIAVLLAIPIGYLFGSLLELRPEDRVPNMQEEVFEMELYMIGAVVGFICSYIMRIIAWAVGKYLKD